MTPLSRFAGGLAAVATTVTLAFPVAAGAKVPKKAGERTFQETYPLASRICSKVAAGTESKHLQPFATQITADCATLESSFNAAKTTIVTTRATILTQIAADRAATAVACPAPKDGHPACVKARNLENAAINVLHHQLGHARRVYYVAVETARVLFWRAFRSIPGEGHAKADLPIPVLPS